MKIICSWCKKLLGEKEPFDDQATTHAKCTDCLEKQKKEDEQSKAEAQSYRKKQTITFKNGLQGILWAVQKESQKLSFFEMLVNRKGFFCHESSRQKFKEYIDGLAVDNVDVTFLHSFEVPLPPSERGKRKMTPPADKPNPKSTTYNCTVKVPKQDVYSMFDDMAERSGRFVDLVMDASMEKVKQERQK